MFSYLRDIAVMEEMVIELIIIVHVNIYTAYLQSRVCDSTKIGVDVHMESLERASYKLEPRLADFSHKRDSPLRINLFKGNDLPYRLKRKRWERERERLRMYVCMRSRYK